MTSFYPQSSDRFQEDRILGTYDASSPLMTTARRLLFGSILVPLTVVVALALYTSPTASQWLLIAGTSAVWFACAGGMFLLFRKRIATPVEEMTIALQTLLEGKTDISLPVVDQSEVGSLTRLINDLAASQHSVVQQADRIAGGDYSARIEPRGPADALGIALHDMTENLRERAAICESVADGAYSVEASIKSDQDLLGIALNRMIGQLRSVTDRISQTGTELVTASGNQAEGAKNQSVAIEEMATTVSELLASATSVSDSAANVAKQAERGADECAEGSHRIGNASAGIKGIHERVNDVARLMLDLGNKSQQINGVLNIITELSEQTNLLSLNASIEAAGAGEAGKRFAVVAGEIRKLAERAADSSNDIRELIQGVQEMVNTTILATEEGTKSVHEGVRLIAEVDKSFERIASQVASTAESAKAIEMGSRQQAAAIAEMQKAVNSVDMSAKEASVSATQVNREAQSLQECVVAFQTSSTHDRRAAVRVERTGAVGV